MNVHQITKSAIAVGLLATVSVATAGAQTLDGTMAGDQAAIRGVLATYNEALNSGKTAAVLPLYTDDGIFMPPFSQSAVGQEAVRKAYDAVFAELKFDVRFTVAELVVMAPTWAYVRTNSAGKTAHSSTGKAISEANQELFILQKGGDSRWRIARYSFSPTNPPGES